MTLTEGQIHKLFKKIDKNGDSKVDKEEMKCFVKLLMDTNAELPEMIREDTMEQFED